MKSVLIIGAGLSGVTCARILAEAGYSVRILESRNHIGGNCFDCLDSNGLFIQPYGPHVFHTSDQTVWSFLRRFTQWIEYEHRVLASVSNKLVPFPISLDTLTQLFDKTFTAEEMADFLRREIEVSDYSNPPRNFRDYVVSQVGEKLYALFFENYTQKQWGRAPETLSADVAKRIPLRFNRDDRYFSDPLQGIPREGFTEMFRRMLDHPNIVVELNQDYFNTANVPRKGLTIFTGELDRFFDYKHGKLEYRSLRMEFLTLDKERHQPAAVVNYPGNEPYTRITEFKHFYSQANPKTTLCIEYPVTDGQPYYVVYTEDNLQKRSLYMVDASKLEESGTHLFCGRLAEYRYYNMDQAVACAMAKINRWLKRN